MKDINGRSYAKLSEVKLGGRIQVDGDFTCLADGTIRTVFQEDNRLFILCAHGVHYLDGQIELEPGDKEEDAYYIGMYLVD